MELETRINNKEYSPKSCFACKHIEYGFGDVGDPEGWVCNKKDLYGKEEDDMIRKMSKNSYLFKGKVCNEPN